jgi:hypothetical protein
MIMLQQVVCKLNELIAAICNHKTAIEIIQSQITNLQVHTETTEVEVDTDHVDVVLPLNINIISVMIVNTTAPATEELPLSNIEISGDGVNTNLKVNFIGMANSDTFNVVVKYNTL